MARLTLYTVTMTHQITHRDGTSLPPHNERPLSTSREDSMLYEEDLPYVKVYAAEHHNNI